MVQTVRRFLAGMAFTLGFALSTGLISTLVVVGFWLPLRYRYALTKLWSGFNVAWVKYCCGVDYRVSGLENLPTDTPVVVLSKHQSTWETLFLHWQLPQMSWVIKRELLWVPFFGWAMGLLAPIAIERAQGANALKQVLRQGKALLARGRWVLLFPEGTRLKPLTRMKYGASGVKLAVMAGVPIVPIALNSGHYWGRKEFIKTPGVIEVVIGAPISTVGRKADDLTQEVENWIESQMERITGQVAQKFDA